MTPQARQWLIAWTLQGRRQDISIPLMRTLSPEVFAPNRWAFDTYWTDAEGLECVLKVYYDVHYFNGAVRFAYTHPYSLLYERLDISWAVVAQEIKRILDSARV